MEEEWKARAEGRGKWNTDVTNCCVSTSAAAFPTVLAFMTQWDLDWCTATDSIFITFPAGIIMEWYILSTPAVGRKCYMGNLVYNFCKNNKIVPWYLVSWTGHATTQPS